MELWKGMETWLTGLEGIDLDRESLGGNVRKRGSSVSLLAGLGKRLLSAGAFAFDL